ncbi:polysaccharide lyase 8 family protein [Streptomyces sp. NBC_01387]|uniref:polysaccharide lyase 8 family protein n=1 Tax=unclassified Streptomyces TaxID=2593676 RepID=UPI002257B747|nr:MULTISPECIES: polysaccharide lyase 8 family protein [unclassified Streptomyces]MCX4547956.1 polysaccharide lyase 8 family protein [Streptomyces sp. NBC_01500]WSV53648.1 polysaccharide lyase 8 family protein [Streptomyces sp. NBC_01014]
MPLLPPWSRRTFLATAGASALTLTAVPYAAAAPGTTATGTTAPAAAAGGDEFATLRGRWLDLALGTGYDATTEPYATRLKQTGTMAAGFRASMAPAATSLWADCPFDPPAGITQSYSRLWTMTQAYLQDGTGLTGDAGLLADVISGIDHVSAKVYHAGTTPYGNWWEWQIGSPRLLMDLVAALYDHLTEAQIQAACAAVDHFIPDAVLADYSGTSTGANRVDLCRSVAMRGVNGRSAEKIALARDALSPVFPYVTEGDGLHADGSFIQHTTIAYSGTYGQVMLDGLGRLFTLLAGSTWDVTDPNRQIILDSVEHAYAPVIYNGLAMDSVNGRAVSRGYLKGDDAHVMRSDHFHGNGLIAAMAVIAGGAPDEERLRWQGMIKGWIRRNTVTPPLTAPQFGVADLSRLQAVADAPVKAAPEPVAHALFASMDRAVHRRPGWAANLSMSSERISYYECGNGENPHGWHTGAGMLYWWPGEQANDQYTDWFWPTVDPYRMPGTTVSTKRLADNAGGEWGAAKPAVQWVGGASDGEFAAVGQHVKGLNSTLEARKSWFCVADTVICLGAGITATDGVPVETVVDNRNLGAGGKGAFTLDERRRPKWAHLAGHGGWVFPGGTDALHTLREARTGSWNDINTTSSTEQQTRTFQTLWLDHGKDPSDASYAYLLMPGASRRTLAARADDHGWLEVLANTAARQAVAVRSLGLTAANFWQAGTVGPLTASAPASVLVRRKQRTATLHISEPPRTGQPVEITWKQPVRRVTAADPSVQVLSTGRSLRLRITPGTVGATHTCQVTLG